MPVRPSGRVALVTRRSSMVPHRIAFARGPHGAAGHVRFGEPSPCGDPPTPGFHRRITVMNRRTTWMGLAAAAAGLRGLLAGPAAHAEAPAAAREVVHTEAEWRRL